MKRVIDANQATLGRLATSVAKYLLNGDEVHVINSEKAVVSGKKKMIRNEYKEKREIGTYRKGPFFPRSPDRIVKRSIRGMIPYQTPHGRAAYKRLRCHVGIPEDLKNEKTEIFEHAKKNHVNYRTVEQISKTLGAGN
ncbi:MAG: 50S ribosomal protein L13 [Candidatus Thermoplasmatota archaeon]|nr:50S ribosomal protein L13 [Candidatus Thermoplasmatota archaeon]